MTAGTRNRRPAIFVQQLHRAAAQRGKLDPVFQDLSDHWTRILQRLYPVWALIGPGLSDPGHIEIHSRQIYLDSEALLGSREQIAASNLQARAILRCFGVALHETLHAKHTKRWALEHDIALGESEHAVDRQLAADRRLLEEPRMEAHGVRDFPLDTVRGRFVRRALEAAVTDVILPAFAMQVLAAAAAGQPLTRDIAGRATVYLQARTHYGIVDPATLDGLRHVWRQALGDNDLRALDDLYARVIWIADGELDALDHAARAYRQIIGAPDAPPPEDEERARRPPAPRQTRPTPANPAPATTGRETGHRRPSRSARRSGRQSREPATASSSSSTPTSTCSSCSTGPPTAPSRAARAVGWEPGCRPGGCPTAASTGPPPRRGPARPPLRHPAAPGAHARETRGSTSARRAGASTGAPTPAAARNGPRGDPSPRTRGA